MGKLVGRLKGLEAVAAVFATCTAAAMASAPTTASNERLAERDAPKLLPLVNLPSGASSQSSEPAGDRGWLAGPGGFGVDSPNLVDVHEFWQVPESFQSTVAYIRSHPPEGSRLVESDGIGGPGVPPNQALQFNFRDIRGRISPRQLTITVVWLSDGSTGVRADAQEVWISPRPRSEKVPRGVQEIDIRSGIPEQRPTVSLKLTSPAKIRKVVRLVDALPLDQPIKYPCHGGPFRPSPIVTVAFRGAHHALLARAISNWYGRSPLAPCLPIEFSIHGHAQPPLVGNFIYRLHRLLGVNFLPNHGGM